MPRLCHAALALSTTLTLLCVAPAHAQSHRCTGPGGTYFSDRPCAMPATTTRIGAIGPAPESPPRRAESRHAQLPTQAPAHLSYMGAECASLSDGLRTAGARGLSGLAQQELRRDYQHRCAADESQARQRLSQAQRLDRQAQLADERLAQQQVQHQQLQQQRSVEQCGEMRRIIASKTARLPTMTPGEVADFSRFKHNAAERCPSLRAAD